jgi:Carboxypeptidase regulatory-like domain
MTRLAAFFIGILLTGSAASAQIPAGQFPAAPGLPQAPARDAAPKTGTSRIKGRILAADTGQPLRKAQVRATSSELRENRLATTDREGLYEFTELPAGRYQLTATKGSFVPLQYGQTRPFEAGKPLDIGENQTIERVDFRLPRGSLITGRVVDEFGEPATDVQVSALRYQFVQGRRQLVPAGRTVTTNDLGEYRLFGLPPGQYFVSATLRAGNPLDGATTDRSGYAPTYYPGAPSVSGAERVTVELAQTRSGIDVALATARLARITGTVTDSDGKPLTNGVLLMVQLTGGFTASTGGQIKPDGTFTIANVPPGEYTLVGLNPQAVLGGGGAPDLISAALIVAGEDINDFRLAGVKSSTVSGRVILPQAGNNIRGSTLQLVTTSPRPDPVVGLGGGGPIKVNDDLTFQTKVQPGLRLIRIGPQVQGATLKAVRLNGADVTDSGIEFRSEEDVTGLEVELTTQASELSGVVTDARSQPVKDYAVVVFARDSGRWTNASRYLGNGRPNQDGVYRVRNLPAGDYYAIALDYVEPGSGTDPEFLERIRTSATPFSLTDGQTRTLDLKIVIGP